MKRKYSLIRYALENRALAAVFAAAILFLSVIAPFKSYIMQWLIDAGSKEEALKAMGLGILVIAASHVLEYISRDSFSKITAAAIEKIRLRIMEAVASRSMKTYAQGSTGEVLSCLTNDMKLISDDYYMGIFNICMWGGMGLAALVMLAAISPVLMAMAVALCMLPLIIPKAMAKPLSRTRAAYSQENAAYTSRAGELLKGFEALLTSGGLDYLIKSHARGAAGNREKENKMRRAMNIASICTSLGAWIPSLLVLLVGVFLVFEGQMTIGYLVTANSLTNFVISPFRMVSNAYVNIKATSPIKKRVEALLNEQNETEGALEIGEAGDIALEDVTYSYPDAGRPALSRVSLQVKKGEKVALTGPSGSGKSTIVRLLYRYDRAQSGRITVGGAPLADIRLDSWYGRVSMIPQTPFLFSDTIYENIRLYKNCTRQQVESAVEKAGLAAYIATLPDGLETRVEEGGKNLSGGQMQRIAIARALLRGSDVILVDEATSSLDIATTCAIMDSLLKLDCTVILITHDLYGEAIARLNRIFYLEGGEIKETGTLTELLDRNGGFAKLFGQMQLEGGKGARGKEIV